MQELLNRGEGKKKKGGKVSDIKGKCSTKIEISVEKKKDSYWKKNEKNILVRGGEIKEGRDLAEEAINGRRLFPGISFFI